jgi:predicted lipid-binding transport protein (Tim44 family)
MTLDPLNIILLAIALVVFWRLRSALGTRTGTEKPPLNPIETKRVTAQEAGEEGETVIRFPQNTPTSRPSDADREPPPPPIWAGYAEPGSAVALGLEKLAEADSGFTARSFVEGAKMAYEMVVEGFAKGDKSALKNLLSKDVFDGFSRAIDERQAQGQRVESRFVGIDKATIQSASLVAGKKATITMIFVSELITAVYDKAGAVVDGDPMEIRQVTDVWTFERDVMSRNPNWKLVATEAPN